MTGGSRGIGFGVVKNLLQRGYKVAMCSRKSQELTDAVQVLKKENLFRKGDVLALSCDVSLPVEWENFVMHVVGEWGRIDVLVNNAGILVQKDIVSTSFADMQNVLDVNLMGAFFGMKAVMPFMKRQGGGRIVNVSSIAGLKGFAGLSAYCSSKFALIGLTKVAALEFAASGIRVNAVCPGLIDTPMTSDIMHNDAQKSYFVAATPLGRAGVPKEVGALVGFLADEESSYCTGGVYTVDGGFTA